MNDERNYKNIAHQKDSGQMHLNGDVPDRKEINKDELLKIASNQKIPTEVALELYECKGTITDKSFLNRIDSYVR